ncbi:MAG: hypothetical protein FWD60_11000 [Candidatus Azobacteroides sp.]|nr:hypothetical protein [Candidatus Azobacteroides sp.]
MNRHNYFIRFQGGRVALICLLLLVLQVRPVFSQLDIEAVSPNAASLGKYIDMPVSYFTGIPNISIPLYEIKEKELTMPISLSYHATAFNPNELPGSVGQNWTLNAGGAIVRKVKGRPDDQCAYFYQEKDKWCVMGFYDASNNREGSEPFNDKSISVTQYAPIMGGLIDGEPDEYYFNFGSYSGKFMFNEASEAIVVGSPGFRVEVHPKLYKDKSTSPAYDESYNYTSDDYYYVYSISGFRITTPDGFKYEFGKRWDDSTIGMTAVERTEMLFGRTTNCYTTNSWYLVRVLSPVGEEIMALNYVGGKWNSSGQNERSTYKRNLQLSRNASYVKEGEMNGAGVSLTGSIISSCYLNEISTPTQIVNFDISEANQLLPNYDDIDYNDGDEDENYRYKLGGIPAVNTDKERIYNGYNPKYYIYNGIGNYQVDKMTVTDKITKTEVKSYNFDYTSNPYERLRLLKLQEKGMPPYFFDYHNLQNRFLTGEPEPCPSQIIEYGNLFVDAWGYYTGHLSTSLRPLLKTDYVQIQSTKVSSRNYFIFNIKSKEELDEDITGLELEYHEEDESAGNTNYCLSKITYPLGGFTTFEYEPHTYTLVVDRNPETWEPYLRDAYNMENKAGGLRIKSIKHYDQGGMLKSSKNYLYEMGILTGIPGYYFRPNCDITKLEIDQYANYLLGEDIDLYGEEINNVRIFYLQSILPFSSNGSGSHIGYSKVTEVVNGNGKTEYFYRNFKDHSDLYTPAELQEGKDLHLDDANVESAPANCLPSNAIIPLTSFELERGQLQGINIYDEDNNLLRKERLYYAKPSFEYLYRIRSTFQYRVTIPIQAYAPIDGWLGDLHFALYFNIVYGFDYNIFNYPFNLIKKDVTEYLGNQSLYTETKYDYFSDAWLRCNYLRSEEIAANGKNIKKRYYNVFDMLHYNSYTPNAADKLCFENMGNNGQIFLPVREETLEVLPDSSERILSGVLTRYKVFGTSLCKPFEEYILHTSQPLSTIDWSWISSDNVITDNSYYKKSKQFDKYDKKGNLLQWQGEDELPVSYLWSYNYQYPIAKIENATYDQVKSALGYSDTQVESLATQTNPDVDDISNLLRTNLLNAQVTTYTYKPLVGMTTDTDPRGVVTYYDYDDFGRLKKTYFYDNNDPNKKRILKYYDYHYKN